ncbi:MAG: hypothetical protein R2746_14660 [Acidimicrobiales bacterium]
MSHVPRRWTLALDPVVSHHPAHGRVRPARRGQGWRSWVTIHDHKRIGIMYGAAALCSS